ncbi:hypothetical protein UlMin_008578 [Ulmus minor]
MLKDHDESLLRRKSPKGLDEGLPRRRLNLSMKFRNYVPHDKQLQEGKLYPPVLPKFEDLDPFVNIAPKKPNWDLRRDVQKKLDKLERRTQKALYKLMEEQERQKTLAENSTSVEEDQ